MRFHPTDESRTGAVGNAYERAPSSLAVVRLGAIDHLDQTSIHFSFHRRFTVLFGSHVLSFKLKIDERRETRDDEKRKRENWKQRSLPFVCSVSSLIDV
jgi:hypothetical protein